ALARQTPAPAQVSAPRRLYAGGTVHDSIAPGESHLFTIDVPADTAARVGVTQEGIDLFLKLRRQGSTYPAHGLDFVNQPFDNEELFPPVVDTAATWEGFVSVSLPQAARGGYT